MKVRKIIKVLARKASGLNRKEKVQEMKKSEFENVEFITIGDGAIRIQVAKIGNLNMGIMFKLTQKLIEINQEIKVKFEDSPSVERN